ncbi:MAG TPA: acetyl-CoA hydrolase/transferase C-terminal domain-containing protein [Rhizomicrobium sp.]
MPQQFSDADALAQDILRRVGNKVVLALPLGLGKANRIANALYARAAADRSISLRIFTALTLEKPRYANTLQRSFLEPVIERLFGAWPPLAYAHALRSGTLPPNIEVNEFFFPAGQWLNVPRAQQSYISTNYSHAVRSVMSRGINVIAQLVATRTRGDETRYSLSCNTDLTLELLKARDEGRADFLLAGEVNDELPFMMGEGDLSAGAFHSVLHDAAAPYPLFAPPKEPIDLAEYAVGFHVARMIADGGTLQIGIGQEGDAAFHALILRQKENAIFREAVGRLAPGDTSDGFGELDAFREGLYAATEMFADGFLALIDAGILKREVDGAVLHAGFFLGPRSFYRALNALDDAARARLRMTAISFTNALYHDEDAKRAARTKARFVNNTMMATLLGAAVSDGLEDGRVVSGVGGQYDFVAQAFALQDARSILCLKSTRDRRGKTASNIRFGYGHETIPRHLRDVVVTEYGIADLRDKPDHEVIAAMLGVADSRFQPGLLRAAKKAGKIAKDYEIPEGFRNNTLARIEKALGPLRARGYLPAFPLGTDFDETEQRLFPALELLNRLPPLGLARLAMEGVSNRSDEAPLLARMKLDAPRTMKDRFFRNLLRAAIRRSSAPGAA